MAGKEKNGRKDRENKPYRQDSGERNWEERQWWIYTKIKEEGEIKAILCKERQTKRMTETDKKQSERESLKDGEREIEKGGRQGVLPG